MSDTPIISSAVLNGGIAVANVMTLLCLLIVKLLMLMMQLVHDALIVFLEFN